MAKAGTGGLPPDIEALLAQAIADGDVEDVTPAGDDEYTQILGYHPRPPGKVPKGK